MRKIRLTESQFNNLVAKCVKKAIRESEEFEEDDEYQDAFESGEYYNMSADEKYDYWTEELEYSANEISDDEYLSMLEQRRQEVEPRGWTIPDIVWNEYVEICEDCGFDKSQRPSFVVDNIAVNGDYGDFDRYMRNGESEEDFIARAEDNALRVFPEERYVIWSI